MNQNRQQKIRKLVDPCLIGSLGLRLYMGLPQPEAGLTAWHHSMDLTLSISRW